MTDLLHLRHQNKEASAPLIIPVNVLVNTPASKLLENIRFNSSNNNKWIKREEPHNRVAILCGSGYSLKNDIGKVHSMDGDVFALNAACGFLNENGIIPDYQVMIDAKPNTASLIAGAKEHLFGATVDPLCFEKTDATLFQLQIDDDETQEYLDKIAPHDYTMMCTAVSVGLVAASLVYTMGYRKLHFFGYDSSHKGEESHVVKQEMNSDVPCMEVEFAGKSYLSSLPMKLQAERFLNIAHLLEQEGCELIVHGDGLLPAMYNAKGEDLTEQEKYQRMWSMQTYRDYSPAQQVVGDIIKTLQPDDTILDFGCGTGRAAREITDLGHNVILIDFTSNCRDECASDLPFVQLDLLESMPLRAKYGYCIDVMEHIEKRNVEKAINNIMKSATKVFFQISTVDDKCGPMIGHVLHHTVKPMSWWSSKMKELGYVVLFEKSNATDCQLLVTKGA